MSSEEGKSESRKILDEIRSNGYKDYKEPEEVVRKTEKRKYKAIELLEVIGKIELILSVVVGVYIWTTLADGEVGGLVLGISVVFQGLVVYLLILAIKYISDNVEDIKNSNR